MNKVLVLIKVHLNLLYRGCYGILRMRDWVHLCVRFERPNFLSVTVMELHLKIHSALKLKKLKVKVTRDIVLLGSSMYEVKRPNSHCIFVMELHIKIQLTLKPETLKVNITMDSVLQSPGPSMREVWET